MTQARKASYGVMTPPPLDRWIEAVLMLLVSLAQGVAATFGMRRCGGERDWHTRSDATVLPQTKPGSRLETTTPNHAVILGLVPRIPVGSTRGQANAPLETPNRDSRHKAENDTVGVEALEQEAGLLARVPREGGDPVSAQRALPTSTRTPVLPAEARQREELEPRGHTHLRQPPLASGSRASRATGMTPSMCVQISSL